VLSAEASVVSLARFRAVPGVEAFFDAQLEVLRDQCYGVVRAISVQYDRQRPMLDTIARLEPDVRLDVEERAAILEFDANLSRYDATVEALRLFIEGLNGTGKS
jgi:hypothetical protein